jgi:hypothetical protein
MNSDNRISVLECLQGRALSAVTFVQDYIQLQFDGALLSAYVWPCVQTSEKATDAGQPGYRDLLCEQIGKIVRRTLDEPDKRILIVFDDAQIEINLEQEGRVGPEAAIFQDGQGKQWNVWY